MPIPAAALEPGADLDVVARDEIKAALDGLARTPSGNRVRWSWRCEGPSKGRLKHLRKRCSYVRKRRSPRRTRATQAAAEQKRRDMLDMADLVEAAVNDDDAGVLGAAPMDVAPPPPPAS